MRTALVGKPMLSFSAPRLIGPAPDLGRTIEIVRGAGRGRRLEVVWDDGLTLMTHLRVAGSWHVYHLGERWRKRTSQMRVAIEVEDWVAVCFSARMVETYREFDRHRHPGFGRLGPDLCRANADLDESVARIVEYEDPDATIAEVLLDQRVACGVGNVYRSEVLHAIGLSPFAAVGSMDMVDIERVVASAARMLRDGLHDAGLAHGAGGTDLAVYGRNGQRCDRCGDTIRVKRVGELSRLLYWCPGCQTRGDSRLAPTPPEGAVRPMDPHPAAVMYLAELPWNRDHGTPPGHAHSA
jgi:endonuclease-8